MRAEATYYDGKIWLRSNPATDWEYREAKDIAKFVGAGRWHKREGAYAFPATVDTCHRLREGWGRDLAVLPPLAQWYRETGKPDADAQTLRTTLADAELTALPTVAPSLFATLRPDQRAGVAAIAATYRGSLIVAPQPGLGKTRQVIGGLLEAEVRGPILVLAPKLAVKRVWYREWREWADMDGVAVHMARGSRATRTKAVLRFMADPAETKVLVAVADMLRVKREPLEEGQAKSDRKKRGRIEGYSYPALYDRAALGGGWSAIVVDESHRLFGSLTVAKSTLAGEGLTQLPSRPSHRRYAVTGTPFGKGGRVQGMFGTLHWCWPDEFTSFWRWAERHFEIEDQDVYIRGGGGRTKQVKSVGRLRDDQDGEDFLRSLGPRILRVTKAEALPWLPPKQYVEVMCEMTPAQLRQYKQLSDEAELSTSGGSIVANGVLAEITRARQVADGEVIRQGDKTSFTGDSGKLDTLLEILEARGIVGGGGDHDGGDTKVVVASRYREFLDALGERLTKAKIRYHYLHGGVSDAKRDRMMDAFQAKGGPRVFVLQSQAGGISVTLDAADELHMLDELDNPEDNEQVEDRVHRGTKNAEGTWNTHQVSIYYYRSEGTIDVQRAEDVEGKRQEQHHVLDARRGLTYVRDMIRYREDG